ncbi:MAG: hypothetical protein ACOC46_03945 [Pirellulales bacterium]
MIRKLLAAVQVATVEGTVEIRLEMAAGSLSRASLEVLGRLF